MKRLVILAILVTVLVRLVLSELTDSTSLIGDTGIPDDQVISNISEIDNSNSGSASITTTMYALPNE